MKRLFSFFHPYKKEIVLAPLFKLLEACFELLVPLVVAQIIDIGIAQNDSAFILRRCLILVALGAVGWIVSITAQYFAARAAVGITAHVRHALFAHIGKLSYSDLDQTGSSTLITRMTSDTTQVQSGINLTLRLVLRSPLVVFGAMIMAFTVDARAASVFAVTIPVLALIVFFIMTRCLPLYRSVQQKLDGVTSLTRQNLAGVRVLRAFCQESDEIRKFDAQNDRLTQSQLRVGRISSLLNPLSFAIVNLSIVVLIYVGALRVDSGILSQGKVIALYNYMSQILVELLKLASLIITITKSIACAKRIGALLEITPSMSETQDATSCDTMGDEAVRFHHVCMKYDGCADDVLHDISFTARRGEVIGIIGGTGSGKTSLVHLIPRFYDASQGEVFVGGVPVRKWSINALRERIGIVPQKAVLFRGTIRDNLLWGKSDATEQEIHEALRLSQAKDFVDAKKEGLDAPVEQHGRNLSGGQRQRLTIARALIRKPDILILDDSSSALDFATDAALRHALKQLAYEPTIFIVSQRTNALRHADRILVLDDGKLVGLGTHDELLTTCTVYREIYESQFKKEEA